MMRIRDQCMGQPRLNTNQGSACVDQAQHPGWEFTMLVASWL
uniref:Uncharacterized protein n=1 Tax=Arundo donax TaxID=35708 RepID=A0A0A9A674_ARUDO